MLNITHNSGFANNKTEVKIGPIRHCKISQIQQSVKGLLNVFSIENWSQ